MYGNWADEPEAKAWIRNIEADLVPQIEGSAASLSVVPEGEPDIKFSVELGLSIMLDKPILAVVRPGTKIPNKLALVADHIIEGDLSTREGSRKVAEKVTALMDQMREDADDDNDRTE